MFAAVVVSLCSMETNVLLCQSCQLLPATIRASTREMRFGG